LVNRQRLNSPAGLAAQHEDGRKLTVMMSRLKKRLGPTSLAASMITWPRGRGSPPRDALLLAVQVLVAFST